MFHNKEPIMTEQEATIVCERHLEQLRKEGNGGIADAFEWLHYCMGKKAATPINECNDSGSINEALEKAKAPTFAWGSLAHREWLTQAIQEYLENPIKLADDCLKLREQIKGHCGRIAAQSALLSKVAEKGIVVRLRDCWVCKDDWRLSSKILSQGFTLHALVLETITIAEPFRKKRLCRAVVQGLEAAVQNGHYDLAIVEGVQNPILEKALKRWGWECDPKVMDFYYFYWRKTK